MRVLWNGRRWGWLGVWCLVCFFWSCDGGKNSQEATLDGGVEFASDAGKEAVASEVVLDALSPEVAPEALPEPVEPFVPELVEGALEAENTPETIVEQTVDSCIPKSCQDLKKNCGDWSDGCGKTMPCGDCQAPLRCGGGGQDGVCGQPQPVNCQPLQQRQGWELCMSSQDRCEGVFTDGTGCKAFCQAAGLDCLEVFEGEKGCVKDASLPKLSCDPPSGHQSDWCVCGRKSSCSPMCQNRRCGPDGCGGSCGVCGAGETCNAQGICQTTTTQENCSQYPFRADTLLSERLGFGRSATGGDPTRVFRVKNRNDSGTGSLREGLESTQSHWIVFDVEGEIRLQTRIEIKSNKTVDGRGRKISILGGLRIPAGAKNIILSDIAVTNPRSGEDAIEVRGNTADNPSALSTKDFWFHHLELSNSGDGLLDVTHAATNITVSWSRFHTHAKAILVASDGSFPQHDAAIRLTFHHNYFDKITRRGPRVRFAFADYFNNYQREWYEYGAASLSSAKFLSENNIYEARTGTVCVLPCPDPNPGSGASDLVVSKKGLINDWANTGLGDIRSVGDLVLNGAQITQHNPQQVFQRSTYYTATPEVADNALKQRIIQGAGPRIAYCKNGTP